MGDDRRLWDFGIIPESTIHVMLRLRGGMYTQFSGRNGDFSVVPPPKFPCAPLIHLKLASGWKTTIQQCTYDPTNTSVADLLEISKALVWTRTIVSEKEHATHTSETAGRKRPRSEDES